MIKILLLTVGLMTLNQASFMDKVGDIIESTLSDNDNKQNIPEVQTVGTLSVKNKVTSKPRKRKDESLFDSVVDTMKDTIGIKKNKKKKRSFLKKIVTSVKEVTGLEKSEVDNSFFDGGILGDMAGMIDLEKGQSYGLPSVFGFNKKRTTKVFGSEVLGDTFLGDMKETSTSFYRGFKNTGESTEFMSGLMYKSSKMYNGMFEIFDDSPMNIFDDKDKREPSIFDMFDKGNKVLDIID